MSPIEQDLLDLMQDTVTIEPRTGTDKFNNLSYGPPVSVKCYIARQNRRSLTRDGREIISTAQVFLADPALVVTADDRLTLPGGQVRAIHEVLGGRDDTGPYWLELRA